MTKTEALFSFWSGFGIPVFGEHFVPMVSQGRAPAFPYLTYTWEDVSFGESVTLSASLWFMGDSMTQADEKVREIAGVIGNGGVYIACDGGALWIRRGTPFARLFQEESDDMVKRICLTISVECWTEN